MTKLDERDRAILREVQRDSRQSINELADRTGLSPSAAQRRLQQLWHNGVICAQISVLDHKKVGPTVTLLVELEVERDRPEGLMTLHRWIASTPEVQQAWCLTGRGDYTLVVVTASIEHFDTLADEMMGVNANIRKFTTSVVLKNLKRSLAIPV